MLNYSEARKRYDNSIFRKTQIPVEHAVSLPMPTKRLGIPGYAYFASPALRLPGEPVEQDPPDRWWIMDADSGLILIFAQWKVMPFTTDVNWTGGSLPPVSANIDELRQVITDIENKMDVLAPAFFEDMPGNSKTRKDLAQTLTKYIPEPLLPQYCALAPDFFAWLEA